MPKNTRNAIIGAIATLLLIIFAYWGFGKVDNGNVGIEYSPTGGVKSKALSQGVHWIGWDKLTEYPIRTTTVKHTVSVATKDGKKTDVDINYSYHVDPQKAVAVYKQFGGRTSKEIENGWLAQKLQKVSREEISKSTLLEVAGTDSSKVQADLLKSFTSEVDKEGFVIEDLSFGSPSIDDQTKKSIDDIIKAGQDNKKAELEAKTTQTNAEAKARAKMTEADGEAQANKKVSDSITDNIIRNKEAEARQKHGWVTVQGSGSTIVDSK